ncbi:integrase [Herbaspirillum rubrisubalbicans]|uniref:tyrosine-type recombinase/integrase n=1 Tax=Herbaspirillum rubrisubalbicans TaxID=80842 RepID=UPI00209E047A|nr:integrase arm-type DNA-binding domain-containing protein [Herbaspirillum rubrisubalbicans]MCP1574166.1 integrase [Herbaspirillum rubrisubalbicans]
MPRKIAPLTDAQCRNAKAKEKEYKLADGNNLNLHVSKTGERYWRLAYRYEGKAKSLTIGKYPVVSLVRARELAAEARTQIFEGIDPSGERKVAKLAAKISTVSTFEAIARKWFKTLMDSNHWKSVTHSDRILRGLERDIFPYIGHLDIAAITTPQILGVLQRIQDRGARETSIRIKGNCSSVFQFANQHGMNIVDPTAVIGASALPRPIVRNHAAIVDPEEIGGLLRAIKTYRGTAIVRAALQFAPLVFLRPGELRFAEWTEFDLAGSGRFPGHGPMWEIPNERMKRPQEDKNRSAGHLVPLSRQAVKILRELHQLTGRSKYVFPNPRDFDQALSANGVLSALRRMGYSGEEMTGHGFRAMARTVIVERLKIDVAHVELQLAHAVPGPLGRAYDRTSFLDERIEMMQKWADYLDNLEMSGTKTVLKKPTPHYIEFDDI